LLLVPAIISSAVNPSAAASSHARMARLAADAGLRVQLGSQVADGCASAAGRHMAHIWTTLPSVEGSYGSLLLTEDIGKDSINFGHGGRAGLFTRSWTRV